METYDVRYSQSAENDLLDIFLYITMELSEPSVALSLLDIIDRKIEDLSSLPHRCPLVDDERLAAIGYRKLHIKNYIAFFTIDDTTQTVYIERILYARRDWLNIL